MGKMSDGPVKVGENDCWAQCHMGTMSRFGVIWAQCHLALPIWHRTNSHTLVVVKLLLQLKKERINQYKPYTKLV